MLKKVLLTGAATLFMMSGAQAADIIEPTVFDWSGAYVGLQGGYAWGDNEPDTWWEDTDDFNSSSIDANGFVGGLHAGYLLQSDSFVYGVEGDIEFADLKDDGKLRAFGGDDAGDLEQRVDWLGSLRLRAGIAMDRALIYATGGLAVGGAKLETDFNFDNVNLLDESENKTKWGWTIGAGVDYALTDDLSARVEYRYTDLGKVDLDILDDADHPATVETKYEFHAVRAGLSWRF